jgi:hypothetical protein
MSNTEDKKQKLLDELAAAIRAKRERVYSDKVNAIHDLLHDRPPQLPNKGVSFQLTSAMMREMSAMPTPFNKSALENVSWQQERIRGIAKEYLGPLDKSIIKTALNGLNELATYGGGLQHYGVGLQSEEDAKQLNDCEYDESKYHTLKFPAVNLALSQLFPENATHELPSVVKNLSYKEARSYLALLALEQLLPTYSLYQPENFEGLEMLNPMLSLCNSIEIISEAQTYDLYQKANELGLKHREIENLTKHRSTGGQVGAYDEAINKFAPYADKYWSEEVQAGGYITRIGSMAGLLVSLIKNHRCYFPLSYYNPNQEKISSRLKESRKVSIPDEARRGGRPKNSEVSQIAKTMEIRESEIIFKLENKHTQVLAVTPPQLSCRDFNPLNSNQYLSLLINVWRQSCPSIRNDYLQSKIYPAYTQMQASQNHL